MSRTIASNLMDKLDKLIATVRFIKEQEGAAAPPAAPTNNASSGNIAGLPPDQPPVFRKKKKNIYLGLGSRNRWTKPQ
jgi:hypothetical protein